MKRSAGVGLCSSFESCCSEIDDSTTSAGLCLVSIPLAGGDVLVWLSDGLIEATNAADDVFGYDAVIEALAGPAASPTAVRDRLLAAIERHVKGEPPADDRTLLVMRYSGP